jgi:hypothetical protein
VTEEPGVVVQRFGTHYGPLSYTMQGSADSVPIRVEGGIRVPPGGIVVRGPGTRPVRSATVDGESAPVEDRREVRLRRVPATVILRY